MPYFYSITSDQNHLDIPDLVCTICTNQFTDPVTTNCSHTFCKACLKEWLSSILNCPICATPLPSNGTFTASSTIETAISLTKNMIKSFEVDPNDVKRFEILGEGVSSIVYRGEWNCKEVAIKVLRDQNEFSGQDVETFRKEVIVFSNLRHPNIILFIGACMKLPNLSILLESVDSNLADLIHQRKRRLTPMEYYSIAMGLIQGLLYIHSRHIIHRDLRPTNILLDKNLGVRIGDFSLPRALQSTLRHSSDLEIGTNKYSAPEVLEHQQFTEKADIFSLGIIFWEMYSCQPPFADMPKVGSHEFLKQSRPVIPHECPASLSKIMTDCWQTDPSSRPKLEWVLEKLNLVAKLVSTFTLNVEYAAQEGEYLAVVGRNPEIGNWQTSKAVRMRNVFSVWSTDIHLWEGDSLEYKYIVKRLDNLVRWEGGANHRESAGANRMVLDHWRL